MTNREIAKDIVGSELIGVPGFAESAITIALNDLERMKNAEIAALKAENEKLWEALEVCKCWCVSGSPTKCRRCRVLLEFREAVGK